MYTKLSVMDMSTAMQQLNWLAVFVAALSTFMIGGLWYSPLLFQKSWLHANHLTKDEAGGKRSPALVFSWAFILSFVMALNLGLFIGQGDAIFGATAGFFAGFGWVALAIGVISLFENKPMNYVLINGGYMTVAFTAMGFILGLWH